MQIFRDSTRKRQRLDSKIQALTVKETTSKAHMQVHTNRDSHESEEETRAEPGRNGPGPAGLGRPAQPIPGPVRRPLWPSYLLSYL
jgi:hypothetical protein